MLLKFMVKANLFDGVKKAIEVNNFKICNDIENMERISFSCKGNAFCSWKINVEVGTVHYNSHQSVCTCWMQQHK